MIDKYPSPQNTQQKIVNLFSTLETIGGKMLKEKHKNYVLLAQGYIDHGRLTLFPIEVYDFIDPPDNVPVPFENDTDQDYGMCSELLDAIEETDKRIVTAMECGVNSVIADEHAQSIRQCGLEELAKRYESSQSCAKMQDTPPQTKALISSLPRATQCGISDLHTKISTVQCDK